MTAPDITLTEEEIRMASDECALAFPYVNFKLLPDWLQHLWLNDAKERRRSGSQLIPCPVD